LEYDTAQYVRDFEGHEKLLVYPFLGVDRVELAAKELSLCDFNSFYNIDQLITLQLDASVGRNQIITFFDWERNSLNECNYVNDNIIDFWMLWISMNIHSSMTSIIILSTHFYTELLNQGVEAVSNWNFNKNRDLFSTEIILVPINLDQHWSLCAIYYANKIQVLAKSGPIHVNEGPFLMHLDSLTYHSADTISRNIRMWLNYEWKKKISGFKGDILNPYNFKLIRPKGKFF
jgi:Ulp1 family protease